MYATDALCVASKPCYNDGMKILKCVGCGNEFERSEKEVKRGRTKYCSQVCYRSDPNRVGKPRSDRGRKTKERKCPVCGSCFLVGGRGHRIKSAIFCGWDCARKARFRHGILALEMSPTDTAHLAGLIEGEGSIILYMRRDVIAMRVQVSNTNVELLEKIVSVTGIGSIVKRVSRNANHKDSCWWQINAEAAESILKQIRSYMWMKTEQADLALETIKRLRDPKLKADRSWQASFAAQMRRLNKRGPVQMEAQAA